MFNNRIYIKNNEHEKMMKKSPVQVQEQFISDVSQQENRKRVVKAANKMNILFIV